MPTVSLQEFVAGWKMEFLRTTLAANDDEFDRAFRETGAMYVVLDEGREHLKIGHSLDPSRRISQLQVGCSGQLKPYAIIAADREVEQRVHSNFFEYRLHGEWFDDRTGDIREALSRMTGGHLTGKAIWKIVPGRAKVVEQGGWDRVSWEPVPDAPGFSLGS